MSTLAVLPEGPWRLTLVTNPDDCNLVCAMCPCGAARASNENSRNPRRMVESLAVRILSESPPGTLKEVIPSTLGEPLLWAGMDALLERCEGLGLRLNLTTNGTWPGRGARKWSRRIAPLASDVKISMNGATPETLSAIQGGAQLSAVLHGVRTFAEERDRVAASGGPRARLTFQVTLQERNVDELPEIVRLAADLGVERVKLNHLQPRVPGYELAGGRPLAAHPEGIRRYRASLARAREEVAKAAFLGRTVLLENAVDLDPARPPPLGPCPFLGKEAFIHYDGRFAPCPHPAALRDLSEGGLGHFGSVREGSLGLLWKGDGLAAFVANWPSHPVCLRCPLRSPGGVFHSDA